MKITILTMFPQLFDGFLQSPVVQRAIRRESLTLTVVDIKEFAPGSFRHIDDSPFGGGAGMVMRCQPVLDALRHVKGGDTAGPSSVTVALSPAGAVFSQKTARRYRDLDHLVLICGHYEGMDERIYRHVDEEVSVGDYILTGGEIPAMAVADAVIRLLPGALRKESTAEESFEDGLLEYPQYTQPAVYEGEAVPEVLLSGNHEKIRRWRLRESLRRTLERRPDLLENRTMTEEEEEILRELMSRDAYGASGESNN